MRIYLLIFAILSCLFLRTATASTSQQFEFGTISGPCVDHSCVINFKNNYDDPLIFLMPSFADGHWNDAPSTLRVISANGGVGGKARIRQYFAPYNHNELILLDPGQCNGANWCLTKQPMTNISYFVIENGADINLGSKGRIIAKSILTNKYLRYKQTASKYNSEEVKTKNLIGENQLENFGVIVESQAVNNISEQLPPNGIFENQYVIDNILGYPFHIKENYTNRWYTPAVIKNSNSFYLALDRGETVINGDYYNNYNYYQKVGYLLVTGAGQYKGLLFSLGHGSTPNTLGQNKDYKGFKNVTLPSERQCGEVTEVPHSSQFKGLPFILASKNSRNGSDGGIFRLCRLKQESRNSDDIEVSFVTDEDLNEPRRGKTNESCGGQDCIERRHADEKFGFMAFQQAVDSETCELFPGPAQSWDKYDSELEGNHNVSIIGAPVINGSYHLGFTEIDNESGGNNQFCNGKECFPAQGYTHLYAKKAILDTWPGVDDDSLESQSDIDESKKEFWFDAINLTNKKVYFPSGSIIHTKVINMHSSFLSAKSNNPDDLIIFVHKLKPRATNVHESFDMANGSSISALIYSERDVDMSYGEDADTRIVGALTAPELDMVGSKGERKSEIIGQSACFESEPNYSLTITPKIKTNTLCDDQPITFNVQASDGSSSNYTGKIRVTISSRFGGQWAENANFTNAIKFSGNTSFDLDVANNQALFWLRANDAEKIMVSGSIDRMEGAAPIGEYSFIPGGFKITPQSANIIAGKPFSATITAVACPADNLAKVITNYNGFKPLKFSTQYNQPATPAYEENKDGSLDHNRPIKVEIMNHQGATDLANIQFTNGKSEELTLRYREAGALKWQVTDPTCTPDSCPFIENNQSKQAKKLRQTLSQGLVGSMSINARPWTFAICPLTFNGKNQYRLANGNISSGEGYASAGKPFDVLLKPLVWQSSKSSRTDIINVSNQNYCGYSVTNNFLATGAPSINGKLSIHYQLDTPKDGNKGNFKSGQMTVRSDLKGLLITGNTWDEVGSIWYQVGLDDYLGMNIDKSQRHIGRFYPAYFALTNPEVTYANSSFTYLQQPFKAGFKLGAYNRSGDLVHNYLSFADDLKATFKVNSGNYVESSYTPLDSRLKRCGNISDPECLSKIDIAQKLSWPNFTKSALSQIDWPLAPYVVMRDQVRNHPITTEPDGPFFDWQLRIEQTTKPDGVTWQLGVKSNSQGVLVGSNDLRYGRMVLQDAAGDIRGPVAIPLRVEYWNGAAFETNAEDSSSHFDGQNYCRQILYPQPDKKNIPSTSGIGNVDQGVASDEKLVAYPDVPALEPFKQQVRFWQRLSNSTKPTDAAISCFGSTSLQPWLSYNWRKQGDDDPSAVVTFGVYQGNKRIIYRAEAGVASSNYQ